MRGVCAALAESGGGVKVVQAKRLRTITGCMDWRSEWLRVGSKNEGNWGECRKYAFVDKLAEKVVTDCGGYCPEGLGVD